MKYLLCFAALIAVAATADLTCKCVAPTVGPECKEGSCTVKDGQCYKVDKGISIENGPPTTATSLGCQEGNACVDEQSVIILTENVFYLLADVKCCKDKNNCNQDLATKLPDFSEVNKTLSDKKLVCPSCFALNDKSCDATTMYCKKGQDKCFTITGTIKNGAAKEQVFNAKGCATPSNLLKANTTLTFGDVTYKLNTATTVEAKSGASPISTFLSFAILLPSILWFLLDSSPY